MVLSLHGVGGMSHQYSSPHLYAVMKPAQTEQTEHILHNDFALLSAF